MPDRNLVLITLACPLALISANAFAMNIAYDEALECEYPNTVFLQMEFVGDNAEKVGTENGICTGAHVGSGIIITVAHCILGAEEVTVTFGEDYQSPQWTGQAVDCITHPGAFYGLIDNTWALIGPEIGFCRLDVDANQNDPPLPPAVPIMVPNGCETDFIRHQLFGNGWVPRFATYVGMGREDPDCMSNCDYGIKRFSEGKVLYQTYDGYYARQMILALQQDPSDGGTKAIAGGDSGGPYIYPMYDGTLRIIGNIIGGFRPKLELPPSTEELFYRGANLSPTPLYLHWIETASGEDITSCHDWDSLSKSWTFTGGAGCGVGYEVGPLSGNGNWEDSSGKISACAANDVLDGTTECFGWTRPWTSTAPSWWNSYPRKSDAALLVEWATNGSFATVGLFDSHGLEELYGTLTADLIEGTADDEEIFLGDGDDRCESDAGNDEIHGGGGDDVIYGGDDDDVIHGSLGADEIYGDDGDDVVIILGDCEVESGEVYDGGAGSDILISPLTVNQLQLLGVTVQNFEQVVTTHSSAQAAACTSNWEFLDGA